MGTDNEFKWSRHLNTILLTIMSIILIYVGASITNLTKAQNNMRIEIALIGKAVLDHSEESEYWKGIIQENQDDIQDIKLGNVSATSDRITKSEALAANESLRKYIEKYYQRK